MKIGIRARISGREPKPSTPHLRRDVVVEVPGVLRVAQVWAVRRRILVDVLPINAAEPRMSLRRTSSANHYVAAAPRSRQDLDQMRSVHAPGGALRCDETTPPGLDDHGIRP